MWVEAAPLELARDSPFTLKKADFFFYRKFLFLESC